MRVGPSALARRIARNAINLGDEEYDRAELVSQIEKEMLEAANALDFERAAFLRDQLKELAELPELVESKKSRAKEQ